MSITRLELHYSVFPFMLGFFPCKWWSCGLEYNGLRLKHMQDACQEVQWDLFLPAKSMNKCMQEHFSAFTTQNLNCRSHPKGEHDIVGRQEYLIISLPDCVAGFLEGFMCSYISKKNKKTQIFLKTMAGMLGVSFWGKKIPVQLCHFMLENNFLLFWKNINLFKEQYITF